MKITTWFQNKFNKKSGNPTSSVPDIFTLSEDDLKLFTYYQIKEESYGETPDYIEYVNSQNFKLLNTLITDFNVKAVLVENLTYSEEDFSTTLEFNIDEVPSKLRNPSISFANILNDITAKNLKVPFYKYMQLWVKHCINIGQVSCKKNEIIKFKHWPSALSLNESDTNNKELCFVSNAIAINDSVDNSELHLQPNIFRKRNSLFKGIVIQNLSLVNNPSSELMSVDKLFETFYSEALDNTDEFSRIAFELYNKSQGRISFISQMNDLVVIKGTDQQEKTIYSTLDEKDLPDVLKKLARVKATIPPLNSTPRNNNISNDLHIEH